jgi:hypothetical protein
MTQIAWDSLPPEAQEYISSGIGLMYLEQLLRRVPIEVAELVAALERERDEEGRDVPDEVIEGIARLEGRQTYSVPGHRIYEGVVKSHGNSARVQMPAAEIGKRVKVIVQDP